MLVRRLEKVRISGENTTMLLSPVKGEFNFSSEIECAVCWLRLLNCRFSALQVLVSPCGDRQSSTASFTQSCWFLITPSSHAVTTNLGPKLWLSKCFPKTRSGEMAQEMTQSVKYLLRNHNFLSLDPEPTDKFVCCVMVHTCSQCLRGAAKIGGYQGLTGQGPPWTRIAYQRCLMLDWSAWTFKPSKIWAVLVNAWPVVVQSLKDILLCTAIAGSKAFLEQGL